MTRTTPTTPAPYASTTTASPRSGGSPVLLAADGRPDAEGAVRVAAAVARRLGTGVRTLAVVEPFATYGAEYVVALPAELEIDRCQDARTDMRRQLATVLPDAGTNGWPVDAVTSSPPIAIAEAADARGARFVVLGLGRHSPVDRIFGSETALGVLRRTTTPVLAVPANAAGTFARAVVAVDFSAASIRAADATADVLAEGGTITLVHVRPRTSALLSGGAAVLAAWEEAYAHRTDELIARLAAMIRRRRPDLRVDAVVRAGTPADGILAAASEGGADLVATGTQGTNAVERLLLGSVSTAIVRRAWTAVLACREPGPAEVARLERAIFGVTEQTDRAAWAAMLADATARNAGRLARVEVDDPLLGTRIAERGQAFMGAVYDRHDRRVELMFADPADRARHVARTLPHVESVQVQAGPVQDGDAGHDIALRVQHGGVRTAVTFE
jgi:nucleotide-binding universal stress UspA family protein